MRSRMPWYMRLIIVWQILRGTYAEIMPLEYPDGTLEIVLRTLKRKGEL